MRIFNFIIFFLIGQITFSQEQSSVIYESSEAKVHFVSEAPLELIEATSLELKGLLRESDKTFAFIISTQSFKGFNSPLQQEHFYENYIESRKYPEATFQGKIIENINFSEDGEYRIRAKGKLKIHGVEQERVIKVTLVINNGTIAAHSQFDVLLDDHNITIPKMVFQKIAERIALTVNITFVKQK
ncbi:MAG: YceI family protein [Bacteroidales bacterium]|nr:YceI family protein [Bacteroidales bacterium]